MYVLLKRVHQTALPVTQMEHQNVIVTNATLSLSSTPLTRIVLVRKITCEQITPNMVTVKIL